jgi:hypothetical protein
MINHENLSKKCVGFQKLLQKPNVNNAILHEKWLHVIMLILYCRSQTHTTNDEIFASTNWLKLNCKISERREIRKYNHLIVVRRDESFLLPYKFV